MATIITTEQYLQNAGIYGESQHNGAAVYLLINYITVISDVYYTNSRFSGCLARGELR